MSLNQRMHCFSTPPEPFGAIELSQYRRIERHKPVYQKLAILVTGFGNGIAQDAADHKRLDWMKASNALDDGYLTPSSSVFARSLGFLFNFKLSYQWGTRLAIIRTSPTSLAEKGSALSSVRWQGGHESPTPINHHSQYKYHRLLDTFLWAGRFTPPREPLILDFFSQNVSLRSLLFHTQIP